MGLQIEDGHGSGKTTKVDSSGAIKVVARTSSEFAYISKEKGEAYSWTSVSADIDAGDTALFLTNDSTTKYLYIEKITMWADVATQFKIHLPSYPTISGTTVTGVNLNTTSGKAAEATARADETGNAFAAGNVITTVRNNESGTDQFQVEVQYNGSVILGYHKCIAVDIIAESAAFECTIFGYFKDISE